MGNDTVFRAIATRVAAIGAPQKRGLPVTRDTELFRDLGIYGDVLVFDLIVWIDEQFGVKIDLNPADYGPPEIPFMPIVRALKRLLCRNEENYKSLTIGFIVSAVEAQLAIQPPVGARAVSSP